jgi:hypothetical protein
MLKKEFNPKDVERVRNLVKGKYGSKTQQSVGYSKKQSFHKEGDIWEENDRKWTIKGGIKQNITKLDEAKKAYNMPLFCPKCKKVMNNPNDKPYYKIHKTCFKCVILKEEKIKKEGKWEEYTRTIQNNEIDNKIRDFKDYVKDNSSESNNQYISEAGDVEQWKGKLNEERVDVQLDEVINYLESLKT